MRRPQNVLLANEGDGLTGRRQPPAGGPLSGKTRDVVGGAVEDDVGASLRRDVRRVGVDQQLQRRRPVADVGPEVAELSGRLPPLGDGAFPEPGMQP